MLYRRFFFITFLSYSISLISALSAKSDATPPYFPYGDYLTILDLKKQSTLDNIYIGGGQSWSENSRHNATACWCRGYNIRWDSYNYLHCDDSTVWQPQDFRKSVYTQPLMQGVYLDSCLFPVPVKQKDRLYILSRCGSQHDGPPQIHDVTECTPGAVSVDAHRRIVCNGTEPIRRQVVTGRFTEFCNTATQRYSSTNNGSLTVECNYRSQRVRVGLDNLNSCLENGDIKWMAEDKKLVCETDSDGTRAVLRTGSDWIPPGDYLITCSHPVFYPGVGNGSGLLTAHCPVAPDGRAFPSELQSVSLLEDEDNSVSDKTYRRENGLFCQRAAGEYGRITTEDGQLKCLEVNNGTFSIETNITEFCQGYTVPDASHLMPGLNCLIDNMASENCSSATEGTDAIGTDATDNMMNAATKTSAMVFTLPRLLCYWVFLYCRYDRIFRYDVDRKGQQGREKCRNTRTPWSYKNNAQREIRLSHECIINPAVMLCP